MFWFRCVTNFNVQFSSVQRCHCSFLLFTMNLSIECYFYNSPIGCSRGAACPFRHGPPGAVPQQQLLSVTQNPFPYMQVNEFLPPTAYPQAYPYAPFPNPYVYSTFPYPYAPSPYPYPSLHLYPYTPSTTPQQLQLTAPASAATPPLPSFVQTVPRTLPLLELSEHTTVEEEDDMATIHIVVLPNEDVVKTFKVMRREEMGGGGEGNALSQNLTVGWSLCENGIQI